MKLILALVMALAPMFADASIYKTGYQGTLLSKPVTLPAGTSTGAIDLGGFSLVGIILPATFTGTAITFTASDAIDGTFKVVKKADGNSLSLTVAQGNYVYIDPATTQGLNFIKIVSGSSEGADRALVLILKGL